MVGFTFLFVCCSLPHPSVCRPDVARRADTGRGHLVVCVHGMAGNQHDLRMLRLQLQEHRPSTTFLMSASNQVGEGFPFLGQCPCCAR